MAPKQDPKPKFQEGESRPLGTKHLTARRGRWSRGGSDLGAGDGEGRAPRRRRAGLCAEKAHCDEVFLCVLRIKTLWEAKALGRH